jgi:murein L,D-transpeptidase YafK
MRIRKAIIGTVLAVVSAFAWAHWPPRPLPRKITADHILVEKSLSRLSIYHGDQLIRAYRISLGDPVGPKRREGDRRTPEGRYFIDWRKPDSAFHRALHISYPSSRDQARAVAAGVAPGGAIMIHGIRNGLGGLGRFHRLVNWTSGCIAVTNPEIEQLWEAIPDGTPIEIRP